MVRVALGVNALKDLFTVTAWITAAPLRALGIGQKKVKRSKEIGVRNECIRTFEYGLSAGNTAKSNDVSPAGARREIRYTVSDHRDGAVTLC